MLNIQEIFSFLEVSKAGGFTAASQKTGWPKSTLSRHVQNLESQLALNLFQRSTRKLKLTTAGEDLFRKAQGLMIELEGLERQFQDRNQKVEGLIRITCAVETSVFLLPSLLASFQRKYPLVHFDLQLSDEAQNLIDARLDIALRSGFLSDSSVICKKLLENKFCLYGHPKKVLPFAKQKNNEIPLVDFETKPFQSLTFYHNKKSLRFLQPPRISTNSLRMTAELAAQGVGLCALPAFMGDKYVQQGKLSSFKPDWSSQAQPLHILYPAQSHLPMRVRLFIDHLIKELSS